MPYIFFCVLIIWSSVAQQEFDHVDTIAIKCVCSHLSWCCNLFTILYFQQQNRREKTWEKKNEVEQVKRSFQDEPWQNIFLSLTLKFAQTGLYLNWIGLDGSHASMLDVAFTAFLLYWFYFFWCWLFDLSFTALKCHAFTLAHIVWWVSYDYLIWSVVQCGVSFWSCLPSLQILYKYKMSTPTYQRVIFHLQYPAQFRFFISAQLNSTRLDSTSLQFSNNNF